jgi:hypothetical protein
MIRKKITEWCRVRPLVTVGILGLILGYIIFREGIFGQGNVGFVYDWNYPINIQTLAQRILSSWDSQEMGGVMGYRTGFYPELLGYGAMFLLGSPDLVIRILLLVGVSVSAISMYWLLSLINSRSVEGNTKKILTADQGLVSISMPIAVAALFYAGNVFIVQRVVAGYWGYVFSYALFPVLIGLMLRISREVHGLRGIIYHGLLLFIVGISALYQLQFIVFALMAMAIICSYRLVQGRFRQAGQLLVASIMAGLLYMASQWFWISQSISQLSATQDASAIRALYSRILDLPHTVWNTIFLQEHANTAPIVQGLNQEPARYWMILGTVVIICLLAVYSKRKQVSQVALVFALALLALPFAVGPVYPFGRLYRWLFTHVPGVSLFRETYHVQYVIVLCTTVCLVWAAHTVFQIKFKQPVQRFAGVSIFITLLLLWQAPALTGNMLGYWGSVRVPDDQLSLPENQRVAYPPSLNFWRISDDQRFGINYPDTWANSQKTPSVAQASSDLDAANQTWIIRNAAMMAFAKNASNVESLFKVQAVGALVERPWLRSEFGQSVDLRTRPAAVQDYWNSDSWSSRMAEADFLVERQQNQAGRVYQYKNPEGAQMIEALAARQAICSAADIQSSTTLYVTGQSPASCQGITPEVMPWFSGREISSGPNSAELSHTPQRGWSPGYLSFYEGDYLAYDLQPTLYTRVSSVVNLPISKEVSDQESIMIRYARSPRGGELQIGSLRLQTKRESLSEPAWDSVMVPRSDIENQTLQITSFAGENAISRPVAVSAKAAYEPEIFAVAEVSNIQSSSPTRWKFEVVKPTQASDSQLALSLRQKYVAGWQLVLANGNVYQPQRDQVTGLMYVILPAADLDERFTAEFIFEPQAAYSIWLGISLVITTVASVALIILRKQSRLRA